MPCAHFLLTSSSSGQHLNKKFFQVNSLQKVPVLKDGDFLLTERPLEPLPPKLRVPSSAILIYQSYKCQVADHWYPPDLQASARIHEYLGWHADNILDTFGVTLWTWAFLMGQQVTLADLMSLEEMMQPMGGDHNVFLSSSKLVEWRMRVELYIGSGLFWEAHDRLVKLAEWDVSTLDPVVKERICKFLETYK
ncbi:Glutathione S-transferase theta-2 [Heterocephalus glaber]|uniref:Glutathione S-transferase theta-2 n=1 Tax=Heterocephalus glaber TaxID=10181 RepID=G5B638_HETGA|nr:Glutathione S-transferase theta-2 [Heterocephalus glaber]